MLDIARESWLKKAARLAFLGLFVAAFFILLSSLFRDHQMENSPPFVSQEKEDRRLPTPETYGDARELENLRASLVPEPKDALGLQEGEPGFIAGVILDPEGKPLPAAVCKLFVGEAPLGASRILPVGGRSLTVVAQTESDRAGFFRIEASEGFWFLVIEHPGMASWEENSLISGDYRVVRLERAAQLIVWVGDDTGASVENAEIRILERTYSPVESAVLAVRTDSSGFARLESPYLGNWALRVDHPDYQSHAISLSILPGSSVEKEILLSQGIQVRGRVIIEGGLPPPKETAVSLEVVGPRHSRVVPCDSGGNFATGFVFPPGLSLEVAALAPGFAEQRVEINLKKGPLKGNVYELEIVLNTPERSVKGRVVDPEGRPLEDIPIFLRPLLALPQEESFEISATFSQDVLEKIRAKPKFSFRSLWRKGGRTDAGGNFFIKGLHPDRPYSLFVFSDRYSNSLLWVPEKLEGGTQNLGTLVARPGGKISGAVFTRSGTPAPGVWVSTVKYEEANYPPGSTFRREWKKTESGGFERKTNHDGNFQLGPLPPGSYLLLIEEKYQFGPFDLREGEVLGPLRLELQEEPRGEEEDRHPIKGRVLDSETEQPVPRAWIELEFVGTQSSGKPVVPLLGRSLTDNEGNFHLSVSTPGRYILRVSPLDGMHQERDFSFELGEGSEFLHLRVQRNPASSPALEGRVLGPDGNPLEGFKVSLYFAPEKISCACVHWIRDTGPIGEFSFGPTMAGMHRLWITDPKGKFKPKEFFPAAPGSPIEIVME